MPTPCRPPPGLPELAAPLRTCWLHAERDLDRIEVTCHTDVRGNGASRRVDECYGTLRRVGAAPGAPAPAR